MAGSKWRAASAAGFFACAIGALLIAGCEREPDELLFIVGRVVHADGTPRPGAEVTLARNGSDQCIGYMGGGLSPDVQYDAGTYVPFGSFIANERGDYLFELTLRDAIADNARYRMPACIELRARAGDAESSVSTYHPGGDVELADMPVSRAELHLTEVEGGYSVSTEVMQLPGFKATSQAVELHTDAGLVWFEPTSEGAATLSSRHLEDFADVAMQHRALAAYSPPAGGLVPLEAHLSYVMDIRGEAQDAPAGALVPVSRGATCNVLTDAGVCGLTDGQLTNLRLLVGKNDPDAGTHELPPAELTIDLGAARTVRRLVARDLFFSLPAEEVFIEVSTDGMLWSKAASLGGFNHPTSEQEYLESRLASARSFGIYRDLPLEVTEPVRFVRIRGTYASYEGAPPGYDPGPVRFPYIREVSIFE